MRGNLKLLFCLFLLPLGCRYEQAPLPDPAPYPEGWALLDPDSLKINIEPPPNLLNYPEPNVLFSSSLLTGESPETAIVMRDRARMSTQPGSGINVTLLFEGQRVQLRRVLQSNGFAATAGLDAYRNIGTWYEVEDELANIGFVAEEDLFIPLQTLFDVDKLLGYFGYWDATNLLPSAESILEHVIFARSYRYPAFYFPGVGIRVLVPEIAVPFGTVPREIGPENLRLALYSPVSSAPKYLAFSLQSPGEQGSKLVQVLLELSPSGDFVQVYQNARWLEGIMFEHVQPAFKLRSLAGPHSYSFGLDFEHSVKKQSSIAVRHESLYFQGTELVESINETWQLASGASYSVLVDGSALRRSPGSSGQLIARLDEGTNVVAEFVGLPRDEVAQEQNYWVFVQVDSLRGWIWGGLIGFRKSSN